MTRQRVLLCVLYVVLLTVLPASIMGLELFRITHRMSGDEAVIAALQAQDHAEIGRDRGRIDRSATLVEVAALTQRVGALESEVDGILAKLGSGGAAAPAIALLTLRVAADEAQIAALTAQIAALLGQPGASGRPGQSAAQRPAGAAAAAPRHSSRCLLLGIVECASGSG